MKIDDIFPVNDLINGLSGDQKFIPCDYYYDDYGSKLFDILCYQEDYYLFRCEKEILHLDGEQILRLNFPQTIIDLGCGTCEKTIVLLNHAANSVTYSAKIPNVILVDVNDFILNWGAAQISSAIPTIDVKKINATYDKALTDFDDVPGPRTFLYLGSNIGNMSDLEISEFLKPIRNVMRSGDVLAIGIDKDKDPTLLEKAYNDSNGIARLTNLNVLSHLNQRYNGDIDLKNFQHSANHSPDEFSMKSNLVSIRNQTIHLKDLDLTVELSLGEPILTEIERKFDPKKFRKFVEANGFRVMDYFEDTKNWYHIETFIKAHD